MSELFLGDTELTVSTIFLGLGKKLTNIRKPSTITKEIVEATTKAIVLSAFLIFMGRNVTFFGYCFLDVIILIPMKFLPCNDLLTRSELLRCDGGGSWAAFSDSRLKKEVTSYEDGLSTLLKISPVKYHYNELAGCDTKQEYVGVIAQQLQEIAPYMVGNFEKNGKEYLKVDNSAMTYMLINSVKEQQRLIESKDVKLAYLQNQLR